MTRFERCAVTDPRVEEAKAFVLVGEEGGTIQVHRRDGRGFIRVWPDAPGERPWRGRLHEGAMGAFDGDPEQEACRLLGIAEAWFAAPPEGLVCGEWWCAVGPAGGAR